MMRLRALQAISEWILKVTGRIGCNWVLKIYHNCGVDQPVGELLSCNLVQLKSWVTLPGLLLRTPDCSTGSCLWEEFIPPSPYTHRVSKTILFFFFFFLTFFLWFSQGSRSSPISRTQVRLCMGLHLAKHTPTYLLIPLPVSQTALSYLALS